MEPYASTNDRLTVPCAGAAASSMTSTAVITASGFGALSCFRRAPSISKTKRATLMDVVAVRFAFAVAFVACVAAPTSILLRAQKPSSSFPQAQLISRSAPRCRRLQMAHNGKEVGDSTSLAQLRSVLQTLNQHHKPEARKHKQNTHVIVYLVFQTKDNHRARCKRPFRLKTRWTNQQRSYGRGAAHVTMTRMHMAPRIRDS